MPLQGDFLPHRPSRLTLKSLGRPRLVDEVRVGGVGREVARGEQNLHRALTLVLDLGLDLDSVWTWSLGLHLHSETWDFDFMSKYLDFNHHRRRSSGALRGLCGRAGRPELSRH